METTLLIYEAHHFDTRWEALVAAAQSKLFAYATIHPHREEIPQPVIGEFADWPAPDPEKAPPAETSAGCVHDPAGMGGPCPFCAANEEAADG